MNSRSLERKERAGKRSRTKKSKQEEEPGPVNRSRWRWISKHRRVSLLPLKWRLRHSSRWAGQVLASELSLLAFLLLLAMAFSKKWLYPSRIRFYQPWNAHIKSIIDNSAHVMSMGLLQFGKLKSHGNSSGRDTFDLWKNHLFFGLAKINFYLALGMGFILTIWLHLPYLPGRQRLYLFVWTGAVMSVCEVIFIFFALMLFPIDLWIFELKMNISIPLGWSYFIGWLVFVLYATCGALCYFSNRHFRGVIQSHSAGISFSNTFPSSLKDYLDKLFQKSVKKEEVRYTKKKTHVDPESSDD